MAVVKGVCGYMLNSKTMMADSIHSTTDLLSDILALVTVKWSLRPATRQFPYGYGKFESLGALGVSTTLLIGGTTTGYSSLWALATRFFPTYSFCVTSQIPMPVGSFDHTFLAGGPMSSMLIIGLSVATVAVKEWLYQETTRIARERKSAILASNAIHHRIDSLTEIVIITVVLGAGVVQDTAWLDHVGGLCISLMTLKPAAEFALAALYELTDRSIDDEVRDSISNLVRGAIEKPAYRGVIDVVSLMGIKSGRLVIVDVEIAVPRHWTAENDALQNIPSGGASFDVQEGELLRPLLMPRVPGTEGSFRAQHHFVKFFKENLSEWLFEWQNSTSKTPINDKTITFSNLIFRRSPSWAKQDNVAWLTLVAHYDSKINPAGFIGATDSAAPCAILQHVARAIDRALTIKWNEMRRTGATDKGDQGIQGVRILFLDGEEAFANWTETDSLYGSRALAQEWESQFNSPTAIYRTPLDSISLFVLLDLLGDADPSVPSYFLTTHWAYKRLADIERRMRSLGLLESRPVKGAFFVDRRKPDKEFTRSNIQDDHAPFMYRGVPILHLIPTPFPVVWHTIEDDGSHLHIPTVRDWARVMTAFVVEWLDIQDYMSPRNYSE
ncbi:hypothetical protein LZL87_013505 [Fusarium oxysporum]|nr:hypothetical protein LZL87_013505 [Fusarium oxysporum]